MFVYAKLGPELWSVGHYDHDEHFVVESDHDSMGKASARVHYLNGSPAAQCSTEQATIGIMAAILMSHKAYDTFGAVAQAREIMDTVYKTEPE